MKNYNTEKEGQLDFFASLRLAKEVVFFDNTDGVINSTLFEFKLKIDNLNPILSQSVKYLSRMRIKGEPVPGQMLLVDLNKEIAYYYSDTSVFISDIEKVYVGASSKNNERFNTQIKPTEIIDSSTSDGIKRILEIKDIIKWTKINIDENCVIGWTERFYTEDPKAKKSELFEELKAPALFKDYINTWMGIEDDFRYIMDCLNDRQNRKELGAFYTPNEYCKISTEMVRRAISEIPQGHDYVIVDRCAGTGNLEQYLSEEELSHCIVATYELKEWQVLNYRLGDRVRFIIPPVNERFGRPVMEKEDLFSKLNPNVNGLLCGGDALAVDVFPEIREYVSDPKCNVILYENPPYRDTSSIDKNENTNSTKDNFMTKKMKEILSTLPNSNISTARDISNQFVWSAWKYYMTKPDDQFILYSPVKYWKSLGLSNKKFMEGYLFNRNFFHASPSGISCVRWKNIPEDVEEMKLKPIDILKVGGAEKAVAFDYDVIVKKVHNSFECLFEKREFAEDIETAVYCESSGYPTIGRKCDCKSYFNENILGYMATKGFLIGPSNFTLVRHSFYNGRGFYLRSDSFIKKLPLFCAKLYPQENWYERDIYFTSADRGEEYAKDADFLKSCLIFTCLSQRNKCISFNGSDGRFYRNELCFDTGTIAYEELKKYPLNPADAEILKLWEDVLKHAKATTEYKKDFAYGLWQIEQELNVYEDADGNTYTSEQRKTINQERKASKKPELQMKIKSVFLNTAITSLKTQLKEYYKTEVQPKLFEYELLK